MGYREEFPEIDPATMPEMPAGFEDQSWHNDASPTFYSVELSIAIAVQHEDPEKRELEDSRRFIVFKQDEDGPGNDLLETDEWDEVTRFIDTLRPLPPAEPAPR